MSDRIEWLGAQPWTPYLGLVLTFLLGAYASWKSRGGTMQQWSARAVMDYFKTYVAKDFNGTGMSVLVALLLIFLTGIIVAGKLMLGQKFPDNYEWWLMFLGAIAGINVGGMIGKRATDKDYAAVKAGAAPTVTAAGPTTINVDTPPAVEPHKTENDGAVG